MLSVLEEKLAEAHGLAIASATVTRRVEERVEEAALRHELVRMRRDAEAVRARCLALESGLGEELATELLAHANSTDERASDLLGAWFRAGTDPLAAWTFLAMGEAAEVAAWIAVAALAARTAARDGVAELAAWALPVQQRHLEVALEGVALLARAFDPDGARWG